MRLRELRQKRGLTAPQLAEKAGISQQRISEYELGKRPIGNMTLATAVKLCDALRVANPRKLLEADKPKENKDV